MNYIQKIKREYLFIGGLLLLIAITTIVMVIDSLKSTPQPATPIIYISPTPKTSFPPKNTIYPSLKSSPGLTKDDEIKRLPGLKSVTNLSDGKIQYNFVSQFKARDDLIITKNNLVIYERFMKGDENLKTHSLSYYKQTFGNPESEILGSKFYGVVYATYIFASKGFAVIGDSKSGDIVEIQIFIPTTTDEYLRLWGEDVKPYTGEPIGP